MERAGENRRPVVGKPVPSVREMGNRRPLKELNNLAGAHPYPRAIAKKPMLEKSGRDEKKPALVSHRPMTRKVALLLENKEQLVHPATAADAAKPGVDPQDEPIPDDTDEEIESAEDDTDMDEEEQEDIVDDVSLMDIDSVDSGNPLAATEYVEEIYRFYRENEKMSCVRPDYMSSQEDINEKMRAILIDWLIEEVSVPVVEDLVLISDRAYTKGQILEMEKSVLNTLEYNMSVPTPYVFMRRFLKAADSDKQLQLVSFFMLELCLVEYQMLKYCPSLLAAAAVYTAQCAINRCWQWTKICETHSRYTRDQLIECSKMMVQFHQKAAGGKLTGVHRKYSTFKFGCVTKVEPAHFLLGG
ncbi:unnamed protein product [Triticum turgidum subsp. durum]|uniref:Cyclin N-terminal domain-containing protein n=1 Tax=Triticum turgidum subsp. durum TaxID=4567 RepID=A0A9R1P1W9_TRITD|nr:unnamed protein product [Triticum turgidum subsp. durum]